MKPLICARCNQEVRHGHRGGRLAWWHRGDADHEAILGNSHVDHDHVEHQRHKLRERHVKVNPEGFPLLFEIEEYSAASVEFKAMSKEARERDVVSNTLETDDEPEESELEPIEVRCTPINHKGETVVTTVDGATRAVTTPGGARTLLNLAAKVGWHVERLTYSRGPFLGSKGGSLGVADFVVLVVRGPVLDGRRVYGIASWRNGKSQYAWRVENNVITSVGARALSTWMKEVPSAEDAS